VQLASLLRRARSGALASSLIVMAGFVLSRATGVLRDVIATALFGTSAEYTAYVAAFRITDLLYLVFIGGALGSSFIPVFIQAWEREGEGRAWELASGVVTWALMLLAAASAALFVAAPWLTAALYGGPEVTAATLDLITGLSRLFLLSPLLLGLGGLAMAALNARDRFTLPALAPSVYNLGIIGGALCAPLLGVGIWGMAWGVVAGALLYLLVQLPGLRALGMRIRPTLGRGVAELGQVARQMGPRVLGQAASHVSAAATLVLAARLPDGEPKIAALGIAFQVMLLPYGVFSLSLSQVAFPRLARLHAEGRHAELGADVRRTLGTILWLTLPAAAGLVVLGAPAVRVLFQRGEFDETSLRYTVAALSGYAAALPAFAASEILIRAFYAMQRTWTPVLVGLLQVGLNLSLGAALLGAGGDVDALALAFSLANNAEAALLMLLLARSLPGLWRDAGLWRTVLASLAASLAVGSGAIALRRALEPLEPALALGAAYSWRSDLPLLLGALITIALASTALYLALSLALGAAPARAALGRLRQAARR